MSKVFKVFTKFRSLGKNRFQFKLKTLYFDNGGEYIGLSNFLATHGISHLTTPPHTLEHNGLAERRHRHIVKTRLALLSHASMCRSYWTYAFPAAVYLINRMPTPVLHLISPFQKLFSHSPNFEKLKFFGCLCFPWLKPYASNKLDARSTSCVFLGYSIMQSAYLCLDYTNSKIYTSRHVLFHETVFPFSVARNLTTNGSAQFEEMPTMPSTVTPTQTYQPSVPITPLTTVPQTANPLPATSPAPTTSMATAAENSETQQPAAQQPPPRMSTRN